MNRKFLIALALLILAILTMVLWNTQRIKPSTTPQTPPIPAPQNTAPAASLTVSVIQPSWQQWPQTLRASGNVAAWQNVVISSEISGYRITEVLADVGTRVRKGQVLLRMNQDSLNADLAQAQAQVQEAQAVLSDATQNANRLQSLKASGAVSSQEVEQYSTNRQTAQARLLAAQAQIQAIKVRLAQSTIVAPDDGIISNRVAAVGALAQSGQPLFELIRQGRLEWQAQVASDQLHRITSSMQVSVMSSDPLAAPIIGQVRMIGPVVDTQQRYGLVYVDLPAQNSLKAGMYVDGDFMLSNQRVLTVPQSAVMLRDGFSYVFSVDSHNIVHQHKVSIQSRQGERVAISGLDEQLNIIEAGVSFINEGDTVRIAKALPAVTGAAEQLLTDTRGE